MANGYSFNLGTGVNTGNSDVDYIFINDNVAINFETVFFADNSFDYFPSMQLYLADKTGVISDNFPFVESVQMQGTLSVPETAQKMQHNFYWTGWQLNKGMKFNNVAGDVIWNAVSNYRKKDNIKSTAFGVSSLQNQGINLGNVIKRITAPYGFTKTIVDPLIHNNDLFYQANQTDFYFINELTKIAQSGNSSPYISFINLQNEFYFDTVYNLLSQQIDPDLKFNIEISALSNFQPTDISGYGLNFGGAETNEPHYRKDAYYLDSTGVYRTKAYKLKDFYTSPNIQGTEIGNAGNQALWINDEYTKNLKGVLFTGLVDNRNQLDGHFKGKLSYSMVNGLISYRMDIIVPFNYKAVSGRTVEVKVKNTNSDFSKTYGGKWLIWKSLHQWQREKRTAWSTLSLLKSGLEFDPTNQTIAKLFPKFSLNLPGIPSSNSTKSV